MTKHNLTKQKGKNFNLRTLPIAYNRMRIPMDDETMQLLVIHVPLTENNRVL